MGLKTKRNKQNKKLLLSTSIVIVLILVSGIGGFFIGRASDEKVSAVSGAILSQKQMPDEFNFPLMREIWKILQDEYVDRDEIDNQNVFYTMMSGMVAGLEDPYTVFLDPEQTKEFNEDIDGKFQGIGAEIAIRDGRLTIVAPLPDSPAYRAGLKAGDKIISVDGRDTAEMTLAEAVKNIRGEKGTTVKLLIVREESEPFEVEVTRDVIYIKSVKSEIKEGNIGYIEISSFNTDTNELFAGVVSEMKEKNVSGIVLDLRNNPGGLLDAAINVSSAWVDNSNVVVIEQFGDGQKVEYNAKGTTALSGIPTIVLINEGSASGAEIVAGALGDYDLATLVGKKSFGKGSVQNLHTLSDGSSVKITIAKWLTPNGSSINDEGIEPDVEVELTTEDYENEKDPQFDKAMAILQEQIK